MAHSSVEERTKEECYKFLKQIKDSCYDQIIERFNQEKHKKVKDRRLIEFTCDKFANYKSAFNKLFGRVCKLTFGLPIACKRYNLEHNNNPIERYNGKIKDRIKRVLKNHRVYTISCVFLSLKLLFVGVIQSCLKSIRSGFKNFEDAKCFMDLRRTIHNFVNPNQELEGKTPAEMAGINLKLRRNKLLKLIEYCARKIRGISR